MYRVLLAARNVKFLPIWIPGQAIERGWHLHDLHLLGRLGRNVKDEDVLIRLLRKQIPARVVANVVSACKNQQRASVWADGGGDRLACCEFRRSGQIRVQGGKMSAASCGRSNSHARRQIGWLGGDGIVVVRQATCFNLKQRAASSQKHRTGENERNEPPPASLMS